MNTLLACTFILFFTPFVISLKCQICGPPDAICGADVTSVVCPAFMDRCITAKITMNDPFPMTTVTKNCSHSTMMCPSQQQYNPCKIMKDVMPGAVCNSTCCEGDLCNQQIPVVMANTTGIINMTANMANTNTTVDADTTATVIITATASVIPMTTNASVRSNGTLTSPTPPSAGVPALSNTLGAIFLTLALAFLAVLG